MSNLNPWEIRLKDLAHILKQCGYTYFEPECFRIHTNHFLQTARTITFIIQKNKTKIPEFDDWYQKNVVTAWGQDELMQWSKNARNTIEKEGDLDLCSQLNVALITSYIEEEDIKINCGQYELLNAGVKKLIRFSQKKLPTGISDSATIKIERVWKTSKLNSHELLYALNYVYSKIYDCCRSLAIHLGSLDRLLQTNIPTPVDIEPLRDNSWNVVFVKLRDQKSYRFSGFFIGRISEDKLSKTFKENTQKLKEKLGSPKDFKTAVDYFSGMAEATFKQWGNHIQMLFLLRCDWSVQEMVTPYLKDQPDKYVFWRWVGEKVKIEKTHCVVFITEAWVRNPEGYPEFPICNLPICGENLWLVAFDRAGNRANHAWPIKRLAEEQSVKLGPIQMDDETTANFFIPPMRNMGIKPDFTSIRKSES